MKKGILKRIYVVVLAVSFIFLCISLNVNTQPQERTDSRGWYWFRDKESHEEEKKTKSIAPAELGSFRFVSWADTKNARTDLSQLSDQAVQLTPAFTIYPGDLEDSGFTQSGMNKWKEAMNGQLTGDSSPNGMFDITFPVRGNHDDSNASGWQNYFDLQGVAQRVGATNYDYMSGEDDLVYSFDYGNSHFVCLDCLGDADKLPDEQIDWLDEDLRRAEQRGLTHAFIQFHGPIYCLNGHCGCSQEVCDEAPQELINVINRHPIVTATFHGHEHVYAYVYLDETRMPDLTHPFHQFVTGDAGAGPKSCKSNRYDYCFSNEVDDHGFITVDVEGNKLTVTWYKRGSMEPQNIKVIIKEGASPVAVDDAYRTDEDTTLNVGASQGVLVNDSGNNLIAILDTNPSHGTLDLDEDGSFTYSPNVEFSGVDTFTYHAHDGTEPSLSATVTITVVGESVCGNDLCEMGEDAISCSRDCMSNNPSQPSVTVNSNLGPLYVGGNADDPAIWVHPSQRQKSLMFLSDKDSGIYVYDFNGNQLQHVNFGTALNNIDVRTGFIYGNETIDIVAGNLRDAGKLAVLRINPNYNSGSIPPVTVLADRNSSNNDISGDSYGFTLYKRVSDGAMFVFDKPKSSSPIRQYRLSGDNGEIRVTRVRTINDVSIDVAEGMVADDELGLVYFAEEGKGIHKYNADPDSGSQERLAFFARSDGISGDREGLALYKCNDGSGYLILSSQGNSQFKVYERGGNNILVKTFKANEAERTDGLDVSPFAVPGFPNGFAIIHDDPDAAYYVYDWADIAEDNLRVCVDGGIANHPPIVIDDTYDTFKDQPLNVNASQGVLANDSDVDGDTLTAYLVNHPSHGQVTLNTDGSFSYTPDSDFMGTDSFTYRANDGTEDSGRDALVDIEVLSGEPPAAPTALSATALSSSRIELGWQDNSSDELSFTIERRNGGSSFSEVAIVGADITTYTDTGLSSATTYDYRVRAHNDAGYSAYSNIASATTSEGESSLPVQSVEADDVPEPENAPQNTLDKDLNTRWSGHGKIAYDLGIDYMVSYIKIAFYKGDERIAYFDIEVSSDNTNWSTVYSGESNGNTLELQTFDFSDIQARYVRINGHGNSRNDWNSFTEVEIYGTPLGGNHPPVAINDAYRTDKDTILSVEASQGVLANDSDPDGDTIIAVLDTNPSHGTLDLDEDGSFTYSPNVEFSGIDTFTYHAHDGTDSSSLAAVIISVNLRGRGIWISQEEIMSLPISGGAWAQLKDVADSDAGEPNLSNQDQNNNVYVLAKALVYVRMGDEQYRSEVRQQLELAIDTELGGRTLALGRELAAYVIAADLINLPEYDAAFDENEFKPWLRRTLTEILSGRTLQSTHEDRPNNWGTHAGASRAAVAVYLNDQAELQRTAQVFKGWVGDRASYAGFEYGDLSWQYDPNNPVGINPQDATKEGHSIDGVLPDDQRRGGGFTWPPPKENYVWEGLQGALVQATILYRAGYDVWNWEDKALLRAVKWLHEQADYPAEGDDTWQPHIINYYYGTDFPAPVPARHGKNMGWTDWTHGERDGDNHPPIAATLVSPSGAVDDTTPTYTWNAVSNATWYKLWVNDVGGNRIAQWYTAAEAGCDSGAGTCSVTPSVTLTQGRCRFWIKTYNINGMGPWSEEMNFLAGSPPAQATPLSPQGTINDTTPTYTWEAVSHATWYKLWVDDSEGNKIQRWYRASEAGCSAGEGSCSVTPTTVLAVGRCRWWVRAWNQIGYGAWSKEKQFDIGLAATLISPSGTITEHTPAYRWEAVPGMSWYKLWVNDSEGNRIARWYRAQDAGCGGGGTCSVPPSVKLIGGNCRWWVKTWKQGGGGAWSPGMDFRVDIPPAKVILISPQRVTTGTTPTYTWSAVWDATWYKLWVNDSEGNKIQQWYKNSEVDCSEGTGTCSITPQAALASGDCSWWVKAWNGAGESSWSDRGPFTVE